MDPNLIALYEKYIWALILAMVWTIVWKGIALWKSARNGQKIWFIALLILNTIGILDIIYILFFSKPGKTPDQAGGYPAEKIIPLRKM